MGIQTWFAWWKQTFTFETKQGLKQWFSSTLLFVCPSSHPWLASLTQQLCDGWFRINMVSMTTCRFALKWIDVCVSFSVCPYKCASECVVCVYTCLKWKAFSAALIREMFVVGENLENKHNFREISDMWNGCTHTRTVENVSFVNKISNKQKTISWSFLISRLWRKIRSIYTSANWLASVLSLPFTPFMLVFQKRKNI